MNFQIFLNPSLTLAALIGGILFGFLLRKATVSRFDTIVGQLLLKDFTVMKVIMTAILVGSIGIYSLNAIGFIPTFHLSPTPILFSAVGGGIFGIGMSVTGYCPGTAIASLAEGSKDMIYGFVGMLVGSLLFNEFSPYIMSFIDQKDKVYQQTFSKFLSVPDWAVIVAFFVFWALFVIGVKFVEKSKTDERIHDPNARN